MKQLILFRHAKSSWENFVSDRERDLLPIGIERTHLVAKSLSNLDFVKPDLWIASPAKRAQKTAQITQNYFDNPTMETSEQLYTFSFFDLLKVVKNLPNQFHQVILFGHNEAFTEFINRMGDVYLENLPTSGAGILEFDTQDWAKIQKGKTLKILKPKELK